MDEVKIVKQYLENLDEIEKKAIINGSERIKDEIIKNISKKIVEKSYDIKNCAKLNEKEIEEKISSSVDKILKSYHDEIHSYIVIENQKINESMKNNGQELTVNTDKLKEDLSSPVKYKNIKSNPDILKEMVTRVNSHIAFKNKNNNMYYITKDQIESFVRQELTTKTTILETELTSLYDLVLKQLNNERLNLLENIAKQKNQQNIQNVVPGSLEAILDEPYEDENVKRF